jgi:hypothetical protein
VGRTVVPVLDGTPNSWSHQSPCLKYTSTVGDLHLPMNMICDTLHPNSSASVAATALNECSPNCWAYLPDSPLPPAGKLSFLHPPERRTPPPLHNDNFSRLFAAKTTWLSLGILPSVRAWLGQAQPLLYYFLSDVLMKFGPLVGLSQLRFISIQKDAVACKPLLSQNRT